MQGRIVAAALTLSLEAKRLREASRVDSGLTRTALTDAIAILGEARDDVHATQNEDGTDREASIAELLAAVAAAWKVSWPWTSSLVNPQRRGSMRQISSDLEPLRQCVRQCRMLRAMVPRDPFRSSSAWQDHH